MNDPQGPGWRRADLLVTVVLAGLAALLVLPLVARARAEAARSRSRDNLRQIGQAVLAFEADFGFFPGNGGPPTEVVTTPDCRTGFPDSEAFRWGFADPKRAGRLQTGCWAYSILPYIGEEETFRKLDYRRAVPLYYIGTRRPAEPQQVPKIDPVYAKWSYQDAGLGPWGRTDYAANDQVVRGGMGNAMRAADITDGLSVTFLAGEKAMDTRGVKAGSWYWDEPIVLGGSGGTGRKGRTLLRDAEGLLEKVADNWGSPDPAIVWFVLCDGSVRSFAYSAPSQLVGAMISPRGGETVGLE